MNKEMTKQGQKIMDLQVKLKDTQEELETGLYNAQLIMEEKELMLEIEKWAAIHESVLRQKSRAVWFTWIFKI